MPNWITGSLKVRGKPENVKKFFMEGLNKYKDSYDEKTKKWSSSVVPREEWVKTDISDPNITEFYFDILASEWIYVEGTRRAFITGEHEIRTFFDQADKVLYVVSDVNQAWGFDPEEWAAISEKFHIDIRLWGLECGMEFGQEIEIIDGKITINRTLSYKNWEWQAPIPWLGG